MTPPTPALDTGAFAPEGSSAAPAQRRSRARRGEGDRLRDEILSAAERILVETNDEAALSIRAIASAVGVTPPSIYLHFSDRNDLLFAVCERHWRKLDDAMAAAAEGCGDPIERIRRRGRAYLSFGLDNPEHYRILMMSRPDQTPERFVDGRLAGTAGIEVVAGEVRAAMEAGALPDQDPLEAATLLWMAVHGVVSLLISKPAFPFPPVEQIFDHMVEISLSGLGAKRR